MRYPFYRGQGLVEYALLILLIGLIVMVLLAIFGADVGNMFSNTITNIWYWYPYHSHSDAKSVDFQVA